MVIRSSLVLFMFPTIVGCSGAPHGDLPQATPPDEATAATVGKPFDGIVHTIPGLIETEHYDLGPAGTAYHDNDAENLGADYREPTQVDIEQRPDASNGHGIGWTRTGEWLTYSVRVEQPGEYEIEIPVASNKQGGVFHLEIDGTDITGPIEIPDTGGWKTMQTITAATIALEAGEHVMKMVMDSQGESGAIGDIDCLRFSLKP